MVGAEVERTAVEPGGLAGDREEVRGLALVGVAAEMGGAEARGAVEDSGIRRMRRRSG